jgi:polysaccharide biosynthesis/export protein
LQKSPWSPGVAVLAVTNGEYELTFGTYILGYVQFKFNGGNMTTSLIDEIIHPKVRSACRLARFAVGIVALAIVAGCQTESPEPEAMPPQVANPIQAAVPGAAVNPASETITPEAFTLLEGNVLKISFPGSPTLDTTQQIRRDGKISLPLVGEVKAAGLTPVELRKELMDLYAPQLSTKEITVEVQNSFFPVYVTGAVLRPGRILSDHLITALEAVMEAGGFDYTKANLKGVTVIRHEGNSTRNYIVNLKQVVDGKSSESFYLKPGDIVIVPEKFSWF